MVFMIPEERHKNRRHSRIACKQIEHSLSETHKAITLKPENLHWKILIASTSEVHC